MANGAALIGTVVGLAVVAAVADESIKIIKKTDEQTFFNKKALELF